MAIKNSTFQLLVVGLLGLGLVAMLFPGVIPAQPGAITAPPSTPPGVIADIDGVTVIHPVQFDEVTSAYNLDLPGTPVATPSITQYIDGIKQASQDTTPPVGSTEKLLVDKSGWYANMADTNGVVNFIVPNIEDGYRNFMLAQEDASVAFSIVNSNGLTANASGAKEAIGTGGAKTLTVRLQGGTPRTYFGNPVLASVQANVMCADANSTQFKMSDFVAQEVGGGYLDVVSAPTQLTLGSTSNVARCWEVPGTVGTGYVDIAFTVSAQTAVDPSSDVNMNLYDSEYFTHSITGAVENGVEDDEGSDVGATNVTGTLYVS